MLEVAFDLLSFYSSRKPEIFISVIGAQFRQEGQVDENTVEFQEDDV